MGPLLYLTCMLVMSVASPSSASAWRASRLNVSEMLKSDGGNLGRTPSRNVLVVAQVAVGRRAFLQVFGDNYDTPDGTGVRDYIHVMDLAEGHAAALRRLLDQPGSLTVNLGTGRGYSVLDVVRAYAAGQLYEAACSPPLQTLASFDFEDSWTGIKQTDFDVFAASTPSNDTDALTTASLLSNAGFGVPPEPAFRHS